MNKRKFIELRKVSEVKHKPILTTDKKIIFTRTIEYKMPKNYGKSIRAKVKIKYIDRENNDFGKVYLVMESPNKKKKKRDKLVSFKTSRGTVTFKKRQSKNGYKKKRVVG